MLMSCDHQELSISFSAKVGALSVKHLAADGLRKYLISFMSQFTIPASSSLHVALMLKSLRHTDHLQSPITSEADILFSRSWSTMCSYIVTKGVVQFFNQVELVVCGQLFYSMFQFFHEVTLYCRRFPAINILQSADSNIWKVHLGSYHVHSDHGVVAEEFSHQFKNLQ